MNEDKHCSRELPHANLKTQMQTGSMKPLTANHSLLFAVKWPNLDLKVSIKNFKGAYKCYKFTLFFGVTQCLAIEIKKKNLFVYRRAYY